MKKKKKKSKKNSNKVEEYVMECRKELIANRYWFWIKWKSNSSNFRDPLQYQALSSCYN